MSFGKTGCPRFVESVRFEVFNRWGESVYTFTSGGGNSIYINWNGKDDHGNDLSTGIYYFLANVVFDVIEPSARKRQIKGWVHLLR